MKAMLPKVCFNFKTLRQILLRQTVVYARKCCIFMNYRQGKNTKWLKKTFFILHYYFTLNVGTCILLPFVNKLTIFFLQVSTFYFFPASILIEAGNTACSWGPNNSEKQRLIQVGQVLLMLNLNKIKIIIHLCLYFKCWWETWLHIFVLFFISYQYYK